MKKMIILAIGLMAVSFARAEGNVDDKVKIGGEGVLAFVNACGVEDSPLQIASRKIGNLLMIHTSIQTGAWHFVEARKDFANTKATAAVFIVKDKAMPLSLVAMEERWGMVNAEGLSSESLEKEALRVAIVVLGGAGSKYSASTMRPVFSAEELEKKAGDVVTFDSLMAMSSYIPEMGFKQYRMMNREDAIEEGLIKK